MNINNRIPLPNWLPTLTKKAVEDRACIIRNLSIAEQKEESSDNFEFIFASFHIRPNETCMDENIREISRNTERKNLPSRTIPAYIN